MIRRASGSGDWLTNLAQAIAETFAPRATHPVPSRLTEPPDAWAPVDVRMAEEDAGPEHEAEACGEEVAEHLQPTAP